MVDQGLGVYQRSPDSRKCPGKKGNGDGRSRGAGKTGPAGQERRAEGTLEDDGRRYHVVAT